MDAAEAHSGLAFRPFEAGKLGMGEVFPWDKIPAAHHLMWKNEHKPGNMAVLVSAPRTGLRNLEDTVEAVSS